jgi:hypothetical protein
MVSKYEYMIPLPKPHNESTIYKVVYRSYMAELRGQKGEEMGNQVNQIILGLINQP